MAAKKGRMVYVPPVVIIEVEDIMREDELDSRAMAFNELTRYARVGREVKRLSNFGYNWNKKRKLPSIPKGNIRWQ